MADDLTKIDGISKMLAAKLKKAGVTTYQQIADMSDADIRALDKKLALHDKATDGDWQAQAAMLVAAPSAVASEPTVEANPAPAPVAIKKRGKKLDRSRKFSQFIGAHPSGAAYTQDGVLFNGSDEEIAA